jgi:hypothetical protein
MSYIDGNGSLNTNQVIRLIRQVAKSVDDTLYHCFENIPPEHRLRVMEEITILKNLAQKIEQAEDEFFSI